MTTNTNNTELTEKKNTNESIDGNNNNMESSNDEFSKEINNIYNHIENNTITKDIFKSFINTLNITINNYKQQIQTHKTTTNNNNKKTEILKDKPPTINVNELITSSQLITSFSNIQGRSPKCKLFISFYTKFLTIITQSKHNENSLKTVINYSDIDRIICVPEKTDNILLYAKLTKKIPLNWRKSSIDCFAFAFDNPSYIDENDTKELQICNSNTNLPSKITGNTETQFCRIISTLCDKHINRHDKNLFRTQLESKKSVYYIDATIKFNKCLIYPINSGIFITPKPLRFIPKNEIKYYEYARQGNGLRYFDLDIVLYENENENETKNKKKKNNNIISLTMIDKKERGAIDYYFNAMKIKLKVEGQLSPDNKNRNKNENESGNEESDSDSDDEEYKIEEDNYKYSDSEYSDSDYNEGSESESDNDIDMKNEKENSNSDGMKKKNDKENSNMGKNLKNRKRKRNEIESDNENDSSVLNGNTLNRLNIKRFKGCAIGRKSINNDGNSEKVVSKCVDKKNNKLKSPKKGKKIKDKNKGKKSKGMSGKKNKNQRSLIDMFGKKES